MNKLAMIDKEGADELDLLKVKIAQYDDGFRRAYSQQMGYAFLAGLAVNRAKEILPQGKFIPWVEESKLNRMSANRYGRFVEALIEAHPAVGKCNTAMLQISSGDGDVTKLSEEDQEQILKAVHDAADGKTLTEMYRDLGVIRQPKKQEYHPIRQTPEEALEAEKQAAIDWGHQMATDAREAIDQWTEYQEDGKLKLPAVLHWPAKLRAEIRGLHISLGKILDGIGKKQKPKGKKVSTTDKHG